MPLAHFNPIGVAADRLALELLVTDDNDIGLPLVDYTFDGAIYDPYTSVLIASLDIVLPGPPGRITCRIPQAVMATIPYNTKIRVYWQPPSETEMLLLLYGEIALVQP